MTALLLKWGAAAALFAALLGGIYAFAAFERASGAAMCRAEVEQAKGVAIDAAIKAVRKEEADKRKKVEESHAEDIKLADARIAAESDARLGLERLLARLRNVPLAPAGGDPAPGPALMAPVPLPENFERAQPICRWAAEAGRLAGHDRLKGLRLRHRRDRGTLRWVSSGVLSSLPHHGATGELCIRAPPVEASPELFCLLDLFRREVSDVEAPYLVGRRGVRISTTPRSGSQ